MNKSELIRAISIKTNMTIKDATAAFNAVIDTITETIESGDKVQISGFGTFELKTREARDGINPKTGEKISIATTRTPIFKFGKAYKDSFNE